MIPASSFKFDSRILESLFTAFRVYFFKVNFKGKSK